MIWCVNMIQHDPVLQLYVDISIVFQAFNEWLLRYEDVRTARIILGVTFHFIFNVFKVFECH